MADESTVIGDPAAGADRPPVYTFGPYRLDADSLQLTRDGQPVALPPKVFDTLLLLLRNRHRVVTREDLFRTVWRDVIVSEDSLTQTISALRRALGDDRTQAEYITTVPRRGYRFVAPVVETGADTPPSTRALDAPPVLAPAPVPSPPPAAEPRHRRWKGLAWGVAAAAALAVLAVALPSREPALRGATPVHLPLDIPAHVTLVSGGVLSPAGDRVAFVGLDEQSAQNRIWVRTLSEPGASALPGTEAGSLPFWSPDGREMGFFAGGSLKVFDFETAAVRTLATIDGGTPSGGAWSTDGTILYAGWRSGLVAISAAGGTAREVTRLDTSRQEAAHRRPQFLPDGRRFLFFVDSGDPAHAGTYAGTLDGEGRVRVAGTRAVYAPPGYLLYVAEGVLMAERFDADTTSTLGAPVRIMGNVAPGAEISASPEVLTFGGTTAAQLVWINRDGDVLEPLNTPVEVHNPVLSPDGRYVAASSTGGDLQGMWLIDLTSGASTRLVPDANGPTWSPDGTELAYYLENDGIPDLYKSPLDRADTSDVVLRTGEPKTVTDWAPQGIVYATASPDSRFDLWMLPTGPDERRPMPLVRTPSNEMQGQWSPDGRWLAYTSDESGTLGVQVQSSDTPPIRRAVSPGGGAAPRWRPDGRELFYIAPDRTLMAIAVTPGDTWEGSRPQALFRVPVARGLTSRRNFFAVTPDGERFLFDADGARDPIGVIVNWQVLATGARRD